MTEKAAPLGCVCSAQGEGQEQGTMGEAFLAFPDGQQKSSNLQMASSPERKSATCGLNLSAPV